MIDKKFEVDCFNGRCCSVMKLCDKVGSVGDKVTLASSSGISRSSHPEVFLGKGVPKICSKFTGEHPC